jgi:hypothetical protein
MIILKRRFSKDCTENTMNPNQGVRFLIDDVRAGTAREECEIK